MLWLAQKRVFAMVYHQLKSSFACFLMSFVDFLKSIFLNNSFSNTCTIRVSNSFDLDQARHFVRPDQSPKCLQRLSAEDNITQRGIFVFPGCEQHVCVLFVSWTTERSS